jgi:uncharacterized membrane protein YbhN (UPF0104 family)
VSLSESLGLAAVNALANQLPFSGGLIAKSVYLKQKHRLAYTRFLSATLALYVCFVAANGVVGVAILAYWALAHGPEVPPLLFLGFSVMISAVLLLWLPVEIISVPGKWGKRLAQLVAGWRVLTQNRWLTAELIGLQILMMLLFAGRLWFAFQALSQQVTLAQCALFSAATVLTRLVNVAPGALGVREAIVASVAFALGFDAGLSAVAVALDRLIATSVTVVLGTVYSFALSKHISSADPEPYEQ